MKTRIQSSIILLFILLSVFAQAQTKIIIKDKEYDERLSGRWKLFRIEKDYEIIVPNKKDYFVYFSEKSINFNRDVNTCFIHAFTITDNEIISPKGAGCTRVCCDGRTDKFSVDIMYTGKYWFENDNLIIKNENGTHYLIREEIEH